MRRNVVHRAMKAMINGKSLAGIALCFVHSAAYAANGKAHPIFEGLSKQFSAKSEAKDQQYGELILLLVAVAVLIFVIWLAYQLYTHTKKHSSPDSAWGLYKKLCRVHKLGVTEKFVIRKVFRMNDLEDPLPLFVEPEFFRKVLAEETMRNYHAIIQDILKKLFGPGLALSKQLIESREQPPETVTEIPRETPKEISHANPPETVAMHETINAANSMPLEMTGNSPADHFETEPSTVEQGKTSFPSNKAAKVLLNPIPGRAAFSSLVEPISRISTEIAAASIRHNLSEGRGLNERTFDGVGEQRKIGPEEQSPMFPKSNVPSPDEMLAGESRRTDRFSPVSPTPRYLQSHTESHGTASGRTNSLAPKPGESLTPGDVALLETIVMGK